MTDRQIDRQMNFVYFQILVRQGIITKCPTHTGARIPMIVSTGDHQQVPQDRKTTTEEDSDSKSECRPIHVHRHTPHGK